MERRVSLGIAIVLGTVLAFATMRVAALSSTVERLATHIERLEASLAHGAGPASVVCAGGRESLSSADLRSVASTCALAIGSAPPSNEAAPADSVEAADTASPAAL